MMSLSQYIIESTLVHLCSSLTVVTIYTDNIIPLAEVNFLYSSSALLTNATCFNTIIILVYVSCMYIPGTLLYTDHYIVV